MTLIENTVNEPYQYLIYPINRTLTPCIEQFLSFFLRYSKNKACYPFSSYFLNPDLKLSSFEIKNFIEGTEIQFDSIFFPNYLNQNIKIVKIQPINKKNNGVLCYSHPLFIGRFQNKIKNERLYNSKLTFFQLPEGFVFVSQAFALEIFRKNQNIVLQRRVSSLNTIFLSKKKLKNENFLHKNSILNSFFINHSFFEPLKNPLSISKSFYSSSNAQKKNLEHYSTTINLVKRLSVSPIENNDLLNLEKYFNQNMVKKTNTVPDLFCYKPKLAYKGTPLFFFFKKSSINVKKDFLITTVSYSFETLYKKKYATQNFNLSLKKQKDCVKKNEIYYHDFSLRNKEKDFLWLSNDFNLILPENKLILSPFLEADLNSFFFIPVKTLNSLNSLSKIIIFCYSQKSKKFYDVLESKKQVVKPFCSQKHFLDPNTGNSKKAKKSICYQRFAQFYPILEVLLPWESFITSFYFSKQCFNLKKKKNRLNNQSKKSLNHKKANFTNLLNNGNFKNLKYLVKNQQENGQIYLRSSMNCGSLAL